MSELCSLHSNNCGGKFWYSDTTNIRRQIFKSYAKALAILSQNTHSSTLCMYKQQFFSLFYQFHSNETNFLSLIKTVSKVKVMLIMFFDAEGIIHSGFLLQAQTIIQQIVKEILRYMFRSVRENCGRKNHIYSITRMHLLSTP